MMRPMSHQGRSGWRRLQHPAVRAILLLISFAYIGWALSDQWKALRASAIDLSVDWRWIALATGVVLGTYAMLIQSWRLLLAGWGGHLPYGSAVRIWTLANLGRWIPGKVWSVGALSVLAAEQGVSGAAAAGPQFLALP